MTAVLFLNEVPAGEIAYGMLLCLGILLLAVTMDRISYGRRHRELLALRQSITVSLDNLPEPGEILEEDYQQLLGLLAEEKMRIWNTAVSEKRDLMEYYTMWVYQIKTPIAAMKVLAQAASDTEDARTYELLQDMQTELFKTEQYVEMVLTYVRMEDMSGDLMLKEYALDNLIKQALKKYSRMFAMQKLALHYEALRVTVTTDEKWLVFVLEQILSNALKYTVEGSISIYMEDDWLVIEDTGIGICSEDLPRIFEKGFTGYNGRSDKKSTGIGLYLCKQIIEKLRCQIRVESKLGKGTRVLLHLMKEKLPVE